MSSETLASSLSPLETRTFSAGNKILAEGTAGQEAYRIVSGQVIICKEMSENRQFKLRTLGPGDIFGEMALLEDYSLRTASAIAMNDLTVAVLTKPQMDTALTETPAIISQLLKSLAHRLENTSQEYALMDLTLSRWEKQANRLIWLFGGLNAVFILATLAFLWLRKA